MPSDITVSVLVCVIAAGVAVSLFLLLVTGIVRIGRYLLGRWHSRVEERIRPLVLEAVTGGGVPEAAVAARGARGRAVERVAFSYLAQVRGEGHDLLADLLQRRGVLARVIGRSSWPSRTRRAAAASRLGLIATAEAARQLEHLATGDKSLQVRIVAARSLGKTSEPAAADTLLSLLPEGQVPAGIVASALLELGQEATPALRHALQDSEGTGTERAMAADVLGLLDEMTAYPELTGCLRSPDPQIRISALRALGHLGLPQATDAIVACLAPAEEPDVQAVAAGALGRIGDPRAVPALARCLASPHYWVAHNAAGALALLGPAGQQELAAAAAAGGPEAAHAEEAISLARARAGRPRREQAPGLRL